MPKTRYVCEPFTIDNTPWVVIFECGHSRLPDANAHDLNWENMIPPEIGWSGWCDQCKDYKRTINVIITTKEKF